MKHSSLGIKIFMGFLCLIVLAYFGLQIYRYWNDPLTTTVAYTYRLEDSVGVSGWVVRAEQALSDPVDGELRLTRAEGERVSRGGTVGLVYANAQALAQQEELDALSTRIGQLRYAQETMLSREVALKLDTQISQGIQTLHADVAADRLGAADTAASSLRALILKRDYTYAETTTPEALETEIAELESRYKSLSVSAAASVRTITSPVSGLYSAALDGFESVLTPELLVDCTPLMLEAAAPSGESGAAGKIILGDRWYYAVTMTEAEAATLEKGSRVEIRFAKGVERALPMWVQSVSAGEAGRSAVVLYADSYLSEVTLLRRQSADLVRSAVTGLRVPERAIRAERVTADKEGNVTVTPSVGVYCVVGATARFKPVKVLATGDGFALVESTSDAAKTCLRPGDEVIITASDLFDGQVIS